MSCSGFWLPKRTQSSRRSIPRLCQSFSRRPPKSTVWLEADTSGPLTLQRPLPDDALRIVASGEKEDGPSS
jgi:hypothetical protein